MQTWVLKWFLLYFYKYFLNLFSNAHLRYQKFCLFSEKSGLKTVKGLEIDGVATVQYYECTKCH